LYRSNGELEAHIVNNPKQGRFYGAPRYMFSSSSLTERWLNMEGVGLLRKDELIAQICYEDTESEHSLTA
jgi:hypothetical protein